MLPPLDFAIVCAMRFEATVPSAAWDALVDAEREHAGALPSWRRSEWIAGRLTLRSALAALGASSGSLLPGASGRPVVPSGFAGSISHKHQYVVAAASRGMSLGVDLEKIEQQDAGMASRVLSSRELSRAVTDPQMLSPRGVALAFSAKEAIYKAASDMSQDDIDFEQIDIPLTSSLHYTGWVTLPARLLLRHQRPIGVSLLASEEWVLTCTSFDWPA
ncbi:MAG: 4'-phosphopantetheinyl transferase superfamily protein [Deltaproteobacteria bacterium]|nr:4'-phosphopantetheinyl transferase superfamily protein [Deltaproteobacteria bacterium]